MCLDMRSLYSRKFFKTDSCRYNRTASWGNSTLSLEDTSLWVCSIIRWTNIFWNNYLRMGFYLYPIQNEHIFLGAISYLKVSWHYLIPNLWPKFSIFVLYPLYCKIQLIRPPPPLPVIGPSVSLPVILERPTTTTTTTTTTTKQNVTHCCLLWF